MHYAAMDAFILIQLFQKLEKLVEEKVTIKRVIYEGFLGGGYY